MRSWVLVMLRRRVVVALIGTSSCRAGVAASRARERYRLTDAVSITEPETQPPRPRHAQAAAPRPESAEREILEAAESFLRGAPVPRSDSRRGDGAHDPLTARPSMSTSATATTCWCGWSRASARRSSTWRTAGCEGTGDPRAGVRAALAGVAGVYAEHGLVLAAIADAAGHDPEVESVYYGLIGRFVTRPPAGSSGTCATARSPAWKPPPPPGRWCG